MVYPSRTARMTAPVPIVAEAPGLFSTITLTLSCFSKSSENLRLIGSVEPLQACAAGHIEGDVAGRPFAGGIGALRKPAIAANNPRLANAIRWKFDPKGRMSLPSACLLFFMAETMASEAGLRRRFPRRTGAAVGLRHACSEVSACFIDAGARCRSRLMHSEQKARFWEDGRYDTGSSAGLCEGSELVVVTDDDDRENEGDLIVAASLCTAEKMAFIIRHTSGIVCAPITTDDAPQASARSDGGAQ